MRFILAAAEADADAWCGADGQVAQGCVEHTDCDKDSQNAFPKLEMAKDRA